MKNALAALLLFGACAGATLAAPVGASAGPVKISLLCTGWLPVYSNWETPQVPAATQDAQLTVQIDRGAGRLSTMLVPTGELVAPLEVSERYYSGTSALGRVLFGRNLDAVEISINRFTGEGKLRYLVGETNYPAFVGNCTAARSRS